MASYGSFVSICGYEHHGPNGHLGFAPRLTPTDFQAAFTSAEGLGTFAQKKHAGALKANIALKYGKLRLNTLALAGTYHAVTVSAGGKPIAATVSAKEGHVLVSFAPRLVLNEGAGIVRRAGLGKNIMNITVIIALVALLLVAVAQAAPDTASPLAPGATLQTLAGGFAFTEGPACDAHGNVFFTDQPNDKHS